MKKALLTAAGLLGGLAISHVLSVPAGLITWGDVPQLLIAQAIAMGLLLVFLRKQLEQGAR